MTANRAMAVCMTILVVVLIGAYFLLYPVAGFAKGNWRVAVLMGFGALGLGHLVGEALLVLFKRLTRE